MRFDVITLFPELFEAHLKHGITRRAKLYFLRQRSGKSARIKEKLSHKAKPAKHD